MESRENSKYDELMMRILCEEQSIPDFLNIVFGFLYRRTDLFVEQIGPDQKFGYPIGQCERLIYDSMQYFLLKAKERNQSGEEMHLFDQVVANDIEIDSTEHNVTRTISLLNELSTQEQTNIIETGCSKDTTTNISGPSDTVTPMLTLIDDKFNKAKTSEGMIHDIEVPGNSHMFIKRAATSSSSGSSYNGADKGLYAWSQTITDIEVEVRVDASVLKSSQVFVQISASSICVRVDNIEVLDGLFPYHVKQDETVWTLTPGTYIQIHLEKTKERWWDQLIQSEPKINLQHIDSTRAFSELPQEEQMKVNELIWNDYQKNQGMPTSEQIRTANVLKKAWDVEGSPFKGRPFDPNILNNQ